MLPDLENLVAAPPPITTDHFVLSGCVLHHATDRVFHALNAFRDACAQEAALLRAAGVDRGTARAAAHIGLEFALDDELSVNEWAQTLFRSALASSTVQVV